MAGDLIVITGVSGYIGFKTMYMALAQGYQVRAIVRREEQIEKLKNHPKVTNAENLSFVVVPDLVAKDAFAGVFDGAKAIVHLASPLAKETDDYERDIVKPARDLLMAVLEAAIHITTLRRIVVTSSAVSLIPMEWLGTSDTETVFTERDINSNPTRPFHSAMEAYWASKAFARLSTNKFIEERKPHFDIVGLLPSVVLGPEDLATGNSTLLVGTRAMLVPVLQGAKLDMPLVGTPVHVDDVARAHVDAIKPSVPGNADYVLSSDGEEGIEWDSMTDIARKYFPDEVESGLLKLGGSMPTRKWRLNVSTTEKAFGWKCVPFEKTMRDLIGQYVEFLKKEQN
ncbi:hypothetical protein VE01_07271 [Pseudogymnoascus verrucosus]|uniref:NAD-dependent epimerase/dehydratase domain-containing protein n=1 Tax=Pseudogymnoascus verrucosus TaxID=342668 RepID=A0A1B8GFD4_9PEZI|nr:uncharacterized protein VE01_07271 [Pseudogymnoascus verrucosus]OBT94537.1 hypothetical protein VE01_07271 [Pseudogymnoascus verrucosus]